MIRLRGGLLVLCGAFLGGFGLWLLYLTMGWAYPGFVPADLVPNGISLNLDGPPLVSLPGLAALVLMGIGGAFALLGLGMLVAGRRIRLLVNIVLAFVVIYAAAMAMVLMSSPG